MPTNMPPRSRELTWRRSNDEANLVLCIVLAVLAEAVGPIGVKVLPFAAALCGSPL
jgi:hypothetical protein